MNKKNIASSLRMSLIAAAVFSAGYANAESPVPVITQVIEVDYFDIADINKDNSISFQEFSAFSEAQMLMSLEQSFKAIDKNADGLLTLEENQAFFPSSTNVDELHAAAAGDDQVTTLEEFILWRLKQNSAAPDYKWAFAMLDKDHDGVLSHAEFTPGYVAPEVKPEVVEPEVKPEVKPEVVEPEVKPEVKPDIPTITKPSRESKQLIKLKARIASLDGTLAKLTQQMADLKSKLTTATKAEQSRINRQLRTLQRRIDNLNLSLAQLQKRLATL